MVLLQAISGVRGPIEDCLQRLEPNQSFRESFSAGALLGHAGYLSLRCKTYAFALQPNGLSTLENERRPYKAIAGKEGGEQDSTEYVLEDSPEKT